MSNPEDDVLYQQWLAERAQAETAPEPEPVADLVASSTQDPAQAGSPPAPEPEPAYAAGPVAHQAVAGGDDGDQPLVLPGFRAYPRAVDHLARAHHAGGHDGLAAGVSN